MKKSVILLFLSLSFILFSCDKDKDDDNQPENKDIIWEGDLINPSEIEMQQFYDDNYNIVTGEITFNGQNELLNLDYFTNLEEVQGSINIINCKNLSSISGLSNLNNIKGGLRIANTGLANLEGLEKLKGIGLSLDLEYNNSLKSLKGLENLEYINQILNIESCPLVNFNYLNSLTKVKMGVSLSSLSVQDLTGFENLKEVGSFQFKDYNNSTEFISTKGFSPEKVDYDIRFINHYLLDNYCSLTNFFTNNPDENKLYVEDNKYNPTVSQIISGECEGEDGPIILDGIYLFGSDFIFENFDSKAMLTSTRNEVTQENRPQLKEIFMTLQASSDGFQLASVDDGEIKHYGPGSDFALVTELDNDEPTEGLWRGPITESNQKFTVPEDGLYHIMYDTEVGIMAIAKVEMGIIGAATPGGWAESTQFDESINLSKVEFSIHNLRLLKADYKFRYSNGWKVIIDKDFDLGDGNVGIKVNANWGVDYSSLVNGGGNISNEDAGLYSVYFTWEMGKEMEYELLKTGDLEGPDYTEIELGLIGDGIIDQDGNILGWDHGIYLQYGIEESDFLYYYNWEAVEVTSSGSFKIREGQNWDGYTIGFPDVCFSGNAAYNFESNADGNFVPIQDGIFDIKLIANSIDNEFTLEINESESDIPNLYILGDATSIGWDNNAALQMEENNGIYTITTELSEGSYKFITTLGLWAPMYGTENSEDLYEGNLVYRETESDPDPQPFQAPHPGTFEIKVDINNMTYQVTEIK